MAAQTYSEVVLTFTNDWVVGDKMVGQMTNIPSSLLWTWVTTKSAEREVTAGTPTANLGETTAINFAASFAEDYPLYTVTVQNTNEVKIQSQTFGETFGIWQTSSGSGTMTSSVTNVDFPSKINIRSPYFINVSYTNLTRAILELYIYTGNRDDFMTNVTYTLDALAYDEEVDFEISHLVSDFLDVTFDGEYDSQVVWVNYRVTPYLDGVAQDVQPVLNFQAFDGYGYFEEGTNPELSTGILQTNRTIYMPELDYAYIPIFQDNLAQVDLIENGIIVDTQTFTPTISSNDAIRYVVIPTGTVGDIGYTFQDGYEYLFQDGNVFVFSGQAVDEVLVTYSDASTETIYIETICEPKYTPYPITFVNKFGALQTIWMFKRSDTELTTKSDSYKSFIRSNGDYSISNHQYRPISVNGKEKITLNTGFYPEIWNNVFTEFMLAEKHWIYYENNLLPLKKTTENLKYKTRLNEKLINYTVDFEFAYDKINSVY